MKGDELRQQNCNPGAAFPAIQLRGWEWWHADHRTSIEVVILFVAVIVASSGALDEEDGVTIINTLAYILSRSAPQPATP